MPRVGSVLAAIVFAGALVTSAWAQVTTSAPNSEPRKPDKVGEPAEVRKPKKPTGATVQKAKPDSGERAGDGEVRKPKKVPSSPAQKFKGSEPDSRPAEKDPAEPNKRLP